MGKCSFGRWFSSLAATTMQIRQWDSLISAGVAKWFRKWETGGMKKPELTDMAGLVPGTKWIAPVISSANVPSAVRSSVSKRPKPIDSRRNKKPGKNAR